MAQTLLTLNAGSSSIKFALFSLGAEDPVMTAAGKIEGIGTLPHMVVQGADGELLAERRWEAGERATHEVLLGALLDWIEKHLGAGELYGVGHRVVHGGARFHAPARVTPLLMEALEALCPLAPLHQPHNLAAIGAVAAVRPHLPQVVCFDTGFHHGQSAVATRFAIPRELEAEGVRRYGFHGLSYEYIARRLKQIDPALAQGRVIVAHLGNGASLCAMQAGRSVDTTMGFTALDGLVMGTRCGGIDPGVLLYLLQQQEMTPDAVAHLLYDESGLAGVSGISSDMRVLLASSDPRAAEAVELFTYRIAREAGALASSLRGLDGLVFTAGIGENAAEVRLQACRRMAWLGVALNEDVNRAHASVISSPESRVMVRVIPTDEEGTIAMHTLEVLGSTA